MPMYAECKDYSAFALHCLVNRIVRWENLIVLRRTHMRTLQLLYRYVLNCYVSEIQFGSKLTIDFICQQSFLPQFVLFTGSAVGEWRPVIGYISGSWAVIGWGRRRCGAGGVMTRGRAAIMK